MLDALHDFESVVFERPRRQLDPLNALGAGVTPVRERRVLTERPTEDEAELTKIVDEVIDRLAQQTDVRLHVTLQVEAEHSSADGFADDTVRTISENAKTLRFTDFGWEKD